ncbi:short-chain fatty acid transporter [Prauserella flavalba]|uniref:short-chain fatty acid transporter n=1 Tax=Prauserella flavalba TaxID=1477506 RepID=UPI0036DFD630
MQRVQEFFVNIVRKYLPEPFVLVVILTLLTGGLAIGVEHMSPVGVVRAWGDGFWNLLDFTMQMALVLCLGFVLASTPVVGRLLDRITARVHTPRAAIAIATVVGGVGSYLNWGFGLVIGGIVARKLAIAVRGVHYPSIIAAAYSAFTLYGLGFSSSIPVIISTEGHPLAEEMGVIPLARTIFAWPMVLLALVTLAALVVLNVLLHPKDPAKITEIDRSRFADDATTPAAGGAENATIAERLNHSRIISILIGLLGLGYVVVSFVDGGSLDINSVNFILLFLGILLMGTPAAYVAKVGEGVKTIAGIVLQYPFYAGIMAIMAASGLVTTLASGLVQIASDATLPLIGLITSFVINFFAPSAGGHWVIQGPFMIEAANGLDSSLSQNAMAVMLGNAWNDMVQPLWLLPALALSKLKLKDIMGYLVLGMLMVGVIYSGALLLWGYLSH